ncbi:MAG: right-handed parallel beta-helix repeat-containing protein [candidate division Zixibacteria bacterium]|nr:right-handed parallel beta-helix repeat-containing protein [candidate division Zixibacteria bacterium]
MHKTWIVLCLIVLFCFLIGTASATTRNVPRTYATIQAGINAASTGDTVLVADGTYQGSGNRDLNVNGKAIVVKSVNGYGSTTIDCQGSSVSEHRAFYFNHSETSSSVIDGFTIVNGYAPFGEAKAPCKTGGGISCLSYTSPTIKNCRFEDNYAACAGGAISCYHASPTIQNCIFDYNEADVGGGILAESYSNPNIIDCEFNGNAGGAIRCYMYSDPDISGCTFDGNYDNSGAGGISCRSYSDPTISYCVFTDNYVDWDAYSDDEASCLWCFYASSPTVSNCTFAYNGSARAVIVNLDSSTPTFTNCLIAENDSNAVFVEYSNYVPTFTCCDIWGNAEGYWPSSPQDLADQNGQDGNFSYTPIFCNGAYVNESSRCLPEHPDNECDTLIGALGMAATGCDYVCGDINSNGEVTLGDLSVLIAYLHLGGDAPYPMKAANCYDDAQDPECVVDSLDLDRMVDYLFISYDPLECVGCPED